MKRLSFAILAVVAVTVAGCGIFGKYQPETSAPDDLFGSGANVAAASQQVSAGSIPWREFFTDPVLRDLIDTALVRNADVRVARLQVEQADAALKSAKLGFLPVLNFAPSVTLSDTRVSNANIPLNLDWNFDGIGSITNRKREAQTLSLQAADNEQSVKSRLVAAVADLYCQLQMLDRQIVILNETEAVWKEVLETQKALMENGKAYSTSVNQMEASLIGVQIQKKDAAKAVRDAEAAMCLLLHQAPQSVRRSAWGSYEIPEHLGTGVPADLLVNRPDVRAAERAVEAAFYVTNQARSAMIPGISLSGLLGWSSNGFSIKDPLSLIYNAAASLVQPLFAQGKLASNLKISKSRQQEAYELFAQTLLKAGNEVNVALADCQTAAEKDNLYKKQVSVLKDAYSATNELMRNGKASYIEVLTAQETYLEAQLGEAVNLYNGAQGLISLYAALGGGVN